jgi:hypothetical protein
MSSENARTLGRLRRSGRSLDDDSKRAIVETVASFAVKALSADTATFLEVRRQGLGLIAEPIR